MANLTPIYDHNCTLCPLHKVPGVTCLSGIGNLDDPSILIVGDGPSKQEVLLGRAFGDERGRLLAQSLDEIGFPIGPKGDVFATYAVKCFPSGKVKVKDAKICAAKYLNQEIDLFRPKLVIALGKTAQYAVLGSTAPISKTRGKLFPLVRTDAAGNEWTTQVMPVDHPFSILTTPAKLDPWLADLRRAKAVFYGDGNPYWSPEKLERFDFKVIDSIAQFKAVARELIAKHRGEYLAIDIEASGVDEAMNDDDFRVFSLQFGLIDLEGREEHPVYFLPIQSAGFPWTSEAKWLDNTARLLNRFLSTDYFKLVGHNLKYDLKALRRIGVTEAYAVYDTLMAWSIAHGEAPLSLKTIAYEVSDLGGYEVLMDQYFKEHGTYDAPPEILISYSCLDVVLVRYLFSELYKTILQEKKRVNIGV